MSVSCFDKFIIIISTDFFLKRFFSFKTKRKKSFDCFFFCSIVFVWTHLLAHLHACIVCTHLYVFLFDRSSSYVRRKLLKKTYNIANKTGKITKSNVPFLTCAVFYFHISKCILKIIYCLNNEIVKKKIRFHQSDSTFLLLHLLSYIFFKKFSYTFYMKILHNKPAKTSFCLNVITIIDRESKKKKKY